MFINKIKFVLKIALTAVGLKPSIHVFFKSNIWIKYLRPTLIFLRKLPLRLKYYKIFRVNSLVPTRHLIAIDLMKKIHSIYEPLGIKFFLLGGQLLGAVRQESMAGRPTDIDLGLIDAHFDKFYKNVNLIEKNFKTCNIHLSTDKEKLKILDPDFDIIKSHVEKWIINADKTFYRFDEDRMQFLLDGVLVDIAFFSLKKINGINYWAGEKNKMRNDNDYIYFLENDLRDLDTVKLYDYEFYSPKNAEKYLEHVYGKNWKLPEKKQFIWKKKF